MALLIPGFKREDKFLHLDRWSVKANLFNLDAQDAPEYSVNLPLYRNSFSIYAPDLDFIGEVVIRHFKRDLFRSVAYTHLHIYFGLDPKDQSKTVLMDGNCRPLYSSSKDEQEILCPVLKKASETERFSITIEKAMFQSALTIRSWFLFLSLGELTVFTGDPYGLTSLAFAALAGFPLTYTENFKVARESEKEDNPSNEDLISVERLNSN